MNEALIKNLNIVKFISFGKPGWVKLLDKKKRFEPRSNIP